MKFAVAYKGVYKINFLKESLVDDNYLTELDESIYNHKKYIINDLINFDNEVDIFLSSYKFDDRIEEKMIKEFNPVNYYFSDFNQNLSSWVSQINHYLTLINMIKEREKEFNFKYEMIIMTRFDIEFLKKFSEMNIKSNYFNIVVLHKSGNCDDNYFVFERKYLENFEISMMRLLTQNRITHEINHKLIEEGVSINYIEDLVDSYMGHELFYFVR